MEDLKTPFNKAVSQGGISISISPTGMRMSGMPANTINETQGFGTQSNRRFIWAKEIQSLHNELRTSKTFSDLRAFPCIQKLKNLRGGKLTLYLQPLQKRGLFQIQKDALIGGLLGDCTLQYNGNAFPSYKFDQKATSKEYVDLMYSVFDEFVGTPPKARYLRGKVQSYWFRTFSLPAFDFYAKQFYIIDALGQRKKCVPKLLHRWLTPQSLAFWFMDDGSKKDPGYVLHTEGFTRPDVVKLQQCLGRVFNLQSNLQKDDRTHRGGPTIPLSESETDIPSAKTTSGPQERIMYRLYIPGSHAKLFQSIVEPYMVDCMKYKLHKCLPPAP
jgi:hypothetical protein